MPFPQEDIVSKKPAPKTTTQKPAPAAKTAATTRTTPPPTRRRPSFETIRRAYQSLETAEHYAERAAADRDRLAQYAENERGRFMQLLDLVR